MTPHDAAHLAGTAAATPAPAAPAPYRSPSRLVGWRRVAIAATVCAVLAGLWTLDRQRAERRLIDRLAETAFFPPEWPLGDLEEIVIENHLAENALNRRIVLARDARAAAPPPASGDAASPEAEHHGDGWRLREPRALPAWPDMMHVLVANLQGARRRNEFEGMPDDVNGLTSPTITATFRWRAAATPRSLTMEFGDRSSFNGEIFGRASDRPDVLFTVREQVWGRLAQNFTNYVDLRAFPMPAGGGGVVRLELENATGSIVVALDPEDEHWWIDGGDARQRADREVLTVYLKDLAQVRMARVLEDDDRRDIGDVIARVRVVAADGTATELRVGDRIRTPQGDVWLAGRDDYPNTFVLDAATVEAFMFPAVFFRDRDLFDFAPEDVIAFRVLAQGGSIQIRRDAPGSPWVLVGRTRRPLRQPFLDGIVRDFARLRSRGYIRRDEERQALLFTADDVHVEADVQAGPQERRTVRLRLSRRTPDEMDQLIYALVDGADYFTALPMTSLQRFWLRHEFVLDPQLVRGRLGDLEAIRFGKTAADGRPTASLVLERREHPAGGRAWHITMSEPVARRGWVDPNIADELAARLAALAFTRLMGAGEQDQVEGADLLFQLRLEGAGAEVIESAAIFAAADDKGDVPARLADGSMVRLPLVHVVDIHRLILEKVLPFLDPDSTQEPTP